MSDQHSERERGENADVHQEPRAAPTASELDDRHGGEAAEDDDYDSEEGRKWRKRAFRGLRRWSLVVFTFVLTAVAVRQCDIAAKQTTIAKKQMVADHRPWIVPVMVKDKPAEMQDMASINGRYVVDVKNIGNAPALGVTVQAWTSHYATSLASMEQIADCKKPWAVALKVPLAPSEDRAVAADHVTPRTEDQRRGEHDPTLFVWGRVDYIGIFGEPHATVFCRDIFKLGTPQEYYGLCWPERNCAN